MGQLIVMVIVYGGLAVLGLKSSLASQTRICALACLTLPVALGWWGYGQLAAFASVALPGYLYLVANRREKAEAMARHRAETEALRIAILKSEE